MVLLQRWAWLLCMLIDDLYHTSTWMDPDRTKRLQAILQWSLRQQEEEGERIQGPRGAQIDPEVMTTHDLFALVPPINMSEFPHTRHRTL